MSLERMGGRLWRENEGNGLQLWWAPTDIGLPRMSQWELKMDHAQQAVILFYKAYYRTIKVISVGKGIIAPICNRNPQHW